MIEMEIVQRHHYYHLPSPQFNFTLVTLKGITKIATIDERAPKNLTKNVNNADGLER